MVLWDEVFAAVAKDYPDVRARARAASTRCARMDFVRNPEAFDVVVASNLFGDILTDLSAAVTGSIGLAPSANINPDASSTRACSSRSTARRPDIAGKGIANPLAAILSAAADARVTSARSEPRADSNARWSWSRQTRPRARSTSAEPPARPRRVPRCGSGWRRRW